MEINTGSNPRTRRVVRGKGEKKINMTELNRNRREKTAAVFNEIACDGPGVSEREWERETDRALG